MLIFKEDMNIFLRHLYSYFCYTLQHNLSMEKKIEVEKTYGKTQSLEIFLFFLGKCHFEKNPIFFQKKTRFSYDFSQYVHYVYTMYTMSESKARQNKALHWEKCGEIQFFSKIQRRYDVFQAQSSLLTVRIFEKNPTFLRKMSFNLPYL